MLAAPHLTTLASTYTDAELYAPCDMAWGWLGGRELGLMADVARSRFSRMTAYKHHAVYRYLQTLAAEVAATPAAP